LLIRAAVCLYMAVARISELWWSRRNLRVQAEAREGDWSKRTFPLIVVLHTGVMAGTLLLGGRTRPGWLCLLLALQPLRFWVLATLGERWNARGAVSAQIEVATGGPYAYVRHPNYAIVLAELFALPMAFGLPRLAALALLINAGLLAVRIRDEESLLAQVPGYREHFGARPRFLPGLF
jgi:methyltransferase